MSTKQGETRSCVARRDPREELEVVLEDHRVDRLGRHEHHAGAGISKANQEEQQSLFVEAHPGELAKLALIESKGRDDNGRVWRLISEGEHAPEILEPRLQLLKGADFLFEGEVGGERRLWDHPTRLRP